MTTETMKTKRERKRVRKGMEWRKQGQLRNREERKEEIHTLEVLVEVGARAGADWSASDRFCKLSFGLPCTSSPPSTTDWFIFLQEKNRKPEEDKEEKSRTRSRT